jgi:hypothetical protein
MRGVTDDDFRTRWAEILPWLKDLCDPTAEPYTLQLKDGNLNEQKIGDFCAKYLIADLMQRSDALWFDHVTGNGVLLLKRLPAYLAALFILSSVSRYHPELLDGPAREPTDLGYFLGSMLDAAERFFPQLILELLSGAPIFFD